MASQVSWWQLAAPSGWGGLASLQGLAPAAQPTTLATTRSDPSEMGFQVQPDFSHRFLEGSDFSVQAPTPQGSWRPDHGENTAQTASTTTPTPDSTPSQALGTEAATHAQLAVPTASHSLPSLWACLLQTLEQWSSGGLQGALGLSAEQMAITDAWLLQERMNTWATPMMDKGPSAAADVSAQAPDPESSSQSLALPATSTEIEAEHAGITSTQVEGTADADVMLLTGEHVQIRSGAGADLLLLAARQVTLFFHAEDGANGADTILGFWQGQDRIVLQQESSSQPLTSADVHWIDEREATQFSGNNGLPAERAAAPTVVITHWNGAAHDHQQHLWVDWDGQGDAPIEHVATLIGAQPLQKTDVVFMVD